jgi:hypothetical protein
MSSRQIKIVANLTEAEARVAAFRISGNSRRLH